jgi:hypothetical protein
MINYTGGRQQGMRNWPTLNAGGLIVGVLICTNAGSVDSPQAPSACRLAWNWQSTPFFFADLIDGSPSEAAVTQSFHGWPGFNSAICPVKLAPDQTQISPDGHVAAGATDPAAAVGPTTPAPTAARAVATARIAKARDFIVNPPQSVIST